MKKVFLSLMFAFLIWVGLFYWNNLRGVQPAFGPIPTVTPKDSPINTTGLPLTLPNGFSVSTFAKNISNARVLAWDPMGNLLVSSPATGKVFAVSQTGEISEVIGNLNKPHGLAFKDGKLYIAETDAVAVYDYDGTAKNRNIIVDLPGGGNHFSRTIGFGPDGKLYISIGSSCNVCIEKDARRASIQVYDGDLKPFALGLRNSVFFTWRGSDMWATDMGRDLIGDDIPPDEVNIIKEGMFYGWPYCYGKNIHDKTFDSSAAVAEKCRSAQGSHVDLQAHSAPLGLAFIPKAWAKEYQDDLLVAYHGSWNRTVPTGYKIVRIKLDAKGNYSGIEDFITGWFPPAGGSDDALGRPVDVVFDPQGNLYVSDDKAGVIYKVVNQK